MLRRIYGNWLPDPYWNVGGAPPRDHPYKNSIVRTCTNRILEDIRKQSGELCKKARMLLEDNRIDEAIKCWDEAIELKPDFPTPHIQKGLFFAEAGRTDDAVECCNEALAYCEKEIELRPDFFGTYAYKAMLLVGIADVYAAIATHERKSAYAKASECYDKAIELEPGQADLYLNNGAILHYMGKMNKAVACYDKAIKLEPERADMYINKGTLLYNQGKIYEAIAHYDRAIEYCKQITCYEEDVEYHDRVAMIMQHYVDSLYNKSLALTNLGRSEDAVKYHHNIATLNSTGSWSMVMDSDIICKIHV